ncbi:MAG: hypothetical protein VB013_11510 [Anaerolineaceae bacterium]|nr:hypothetical protein [Anaerolineaceae bacterium]
MKRLSVGWNLAKLVLGIVAAFTVGIVLLGLLLGWKTSVPYSDSFFAVGSGIILLGTLTILGTYRQRGNSNVQYSQSASTEKIPERTSRWVKDIKQGYNFLIVCVVSGSLLISLAVLADKLFSVPAL